MQTSPYNRKQTQWLFGDELGGRWINKGHGNIWQVGAGDDGKFFSDSVIASWMSTDVTVTDCTH